MFQTFQYKKTSTILYRSNDRCVFTVQVSYSKLRELSSYVCWDSLWPLIDIHTECKHAVYSRYVLVRASARFGTHLNNLEVTETVNRNILILPLLWHYEKNFYHSICICMGVIWYGFSYVRSMYKDDGIFGRKFHMQNYRRHYEFWNDFSSDVWF